MKQAKTGTEQEERFDAMKGKRTRPRCYDTAFYIDLADVMIVPLHQHMDKSYQNESLVAAILGPEPHL